MWKKNCIERHKGRFLFLCGGVLIAALTLWRLRYGNAAVDEAFHLTIPYRLLKGDRLILDEWHVTQTSGFLLTPLMALQRLMMGGTEQIALNFRAFWLVEHMTVMTAVYLLLEKRGCLAASVAAWMYGLFTPFGIMALNYNSMGVDAVLLLSILFLQGYDTWTADIFKGFLLAVLALCNPYCVSLYAVLMVLSVVNRLHRFDGQFDLSHVFRWHLGILILLIPFLLHVFRGPDDLRRLWENMEYILKDPLHEPKQIISSTREWMEALIRENRDFFRYYAMLLLAGLLIRRLRPALLGMIALLCAYYVLRDARYFMYVWDGNSMAMFFFFAGFAAFLFNERKNLRTACCTFALPLFYALCVNMASNQGLRSVLYAFLPGCCLGVLLLADFCRHSKATLQLGGTSVPWLALVIAGALSLQLCAQTYMRAQQVFFEWVPPSELNAFIDHGPLKGISAMEEEKEKYERLCQEIESLGDLSGKKVAFFQSVPIGFLIMDQQIGAPSAWMEYENPEDPRLLEYYRIHPQNRPDVFFVYKLSFDEWSREQYDRYAQEQGYSIIRDNDICLVMEKTR